MTRKEHHMAGKGILITGSGVGQATGIGLYTTAETILEAVERSDISMILVPTSTVDKCIGLPCVQELRTYRRIEAIQTKMEG